MLARGGGPARRGSGPRGGGSGLGRGRGGCAPPGGDVLYRRTGAALYDPVGREALLAPVAKRMARKLGWRRRGRPRSQRCRRLVEDLAFKDRSKGAADPASGGRNGLERCGGEATAASASACGPTRSAPRPQARLVGALGAPGSPGTRPSAAARSGGGGCDPGRLAHPACHLPASSACLWCPSAAARACAEASAARRVTWVARPARARGPGRAQRSQPDGDLPGRDQRRGRRAGGPGPWPHHRPLAAVDRARERRRPRGHAIGGQFSTANGNVEDLLLDLEVVLPDGGVLRHARRAPRRAPTCASSSSAAKARSA